MKALHILKSALNKSSTIGIIALISLLPQLAPHIAFAQDFGQPTAKIFEINVLDSSILSQSPKQNENSLSIESVSDSDPLVVNLTAYLNKLGSPMAEHASEIVKQSQWQRALAISYVESHMGKYCFNNNCSGIGGAPGTPTWRKYQTKLDWFIDLNKLLDKPIYSQKYTTFKKMRGVYVQPGSDNWVNGAQKKYDELMKLTKDSEEETRALAQKHFKELATLYTFADIKE